MPVVCDLIVIQGDSTRLIGDTGSKPSWTKTFNTGGRNNSNNAVLMLMVQGMTDTRSDAVVKINGTQVGVIENYNGANASHWFTQIIHIGAGVLNSGNNTLQIEVVDFDNPSPGNIYDDFRIKDVVCFFQQSA